MPPAPAREADEFPRKTWEFFPKLSFSAPFCRGEALGAGRCGASDEGSAMGVGALYRLSPYVGIGLEASHASFGFGERTVAKGVSSATWFGVLVRGYLSEQGFVEPYVETGFGRGIANSGWIDGVTPVSVEASGPALLAGAGVDFWVAPYLRLGPAISYRFTYLTSARVCANADCEETAVSGTGAVGSFATVSFVATVAMGKEM